MVRLAACGLATARPAKAPEPSLAGTARLFAWLGNSAIQFSAADAEEGLRQDCPMLLQQDEHVELAFKVERDKFYFTTRRLLFRTRRAFTGVRVKYQSVPYGCMAAFAVEAVGGPNGEAPSRDSDVCVRLWTEAQSLGVVELSFLRGMANVPALQRHLHCKLLPAGAAAPAEVKGLERSSFEDTRKLFAESEDLDAGELEWRLRGDVLFGDERVELAYRAGEGVSCLLTTKRLLLVSVKGWRDAKLEYTSVLWRCLRGFSVSPSADSPELLLWTSLPNMRVLKQKPSALRLPSAYGLLAARLLQLPRSPAGEVGSAQQLLEWLRSDSPRVDLKGLEAALRRELPLLLEGERLEMGLKGSAALTLLTSRRLLSLASKGGDEPAEGAEGAAKCAGLAAVSLPWAHVQAFAIRTASSLLDKTCAVMFWSDVMFEPREGDIPPRPGMAYLEQDFRKDVVDPMGVHRYVSVKVLTAENALPAWEAGVPPEVLGYSPKGGAEAFLTWLGEDSQKLEPRAVEQQLNALNPMLLSDERVDLAFKAYRDVALFTSKRLLIMDTQGWIGDKVEYKSIPYCCIRGFSVESAGAFDRGAALTLLLRTPWTETLTQDLRRGSADVLAIQALLAQRALPPVVGALKEGKEGDARSNGNGCSAVTPPRSEESLGFDNFVEWLTQEAQQVDRDEVDQQLHTEPPILQRDEFVELAFRVGREMFLLTSKRLLRIDVKGLTGRKVLYETVPYRSCRAFSAQSPGSFDRDAEGYIFTDVPGLPFVYQDLWKGKVDIFELQSVLAARLL